MDEFSLFSASTDLKEFKNDDFFDNSEMCINDTTDLLDIFGLEKLSQENSIHNEDDNGEATITTQLAAGLNRCLTESQLDLNSDFLMPWQNVTEDVKIPLPIVNFHIITPLQSNESNSHTLTAEGDSSILCSSDTDVVKVDSSNQKPVSQGRKRSSSVCPNEIDDKTLASMTVGDLKSVLNGASKEDLESLTKRRRTLKNRQYARTSRFKRSLEKNESEKCKLKTEEDLKHIKTELQRVRDNLEIVTKERDVWKQKYIKLKNSLH